jgi:hypothetical protein
VIDLNVVVCGGSGRRDSVVKNATLSGSKGLWPVPAHLTTLLASQIMNMGSCLITIKVKISD